MSNSSPEKSTLRLYATGTMVLLVFAVVLFDLLGIAHGGAWSVLPAACDERVARYFQFVAWPTFGVMGFVLWLLPLLKEQVANSRTLSVTCFWLMLSGIVTGTAGSVLVTQPLINNALCMLGGTLMLAGSISYTVVVWWSITRTLHPSVTDGLVQCGALWLLAVTAIYFVSTIGRTLGISDTIYLRVSHPLIKSLGIGFIGNSGFWLLSTILPRFLQVEAPRQRIVQAIGTMNGLLVLWVLGESWSTAYPNTWVRLPVALVGVAFVGAVLYLLLQTGALGYFTGIVPDARRACSRMWASAFVVCTFAASIVIAGIGIRFGSSNEVAMPEAQALVRELMHVGMGTFLLLCLGVSLLGSGAVDGWRGRLCWWGGGIVMIGLMGYVVVQLVSLMTNIDVNSIEPLAQYASGIGHLMIALWLGLALSD